MFNDEDANDDDGTGGQTRYPVMPSLVALQQMRNRLHLAFLGRKLMKWTTIATGKELRKLAHETLEYSGSYGDDYSKAFMLLARCRYYYPHLNTQVIHNVGNEAAMVVNLNHRSVAGVRLLTLQIVDREFDPNEHLGLEKGGSAILEAKKHWKELLRLSILMLEERSAFQMLFDANRAANKKQNVLAKLVIPRIQNAIAYIKSELEEREREETFRLKRFKESKGKKKNQKKEEPCLPVDTICIQEPDLIDKKKPCTCSQPPPWLDDNSGKFDCPICKLADRNVEIKVVPCRLCLPEVTEAKHRLSHLMAHVNQVLLMSKLYNQTNPQQQQKGGDTKGSALSYAKVKQQLDYISSTCTCPHIVPCPHSAPEPVPQRPAPEPELKREDSCTCEDPCRCDEPSIKDEASSVNESCCGKNDVGNTKPEFQTYSVYGSSSFPQSMTTGSYFKSASKNYTQVPPFFYLYSGPYVRSETGVHPMKSKTEVKKSKSCIKCLVDVPCADELTEDKALCPCKPLEDKKSCSCNISYPQKPSKAVCTCESTEIAMLNVQHLPLHNRPLGEPDALGLDYKKVCPNRQVSASWHAPNPPTNLAKRITRLSEPFLRRKYSINGGFHDAQVMDPDIAFEPFVCTKIENSESTASSLKSLVDISCTCNIMSPQKLSEESCTCNATSTKVQSPLHDQSLPQSETTAPISKRICQANQPTASIAYPKLSIDLAKRIAKAAEPYFKNNLKISANSVNDLKSLLSKQYTSSCSCESLQDIQSGSCKSTQSCTCDFLSEETSKDTYSSKDETFSSATSGPPYFKKSATFFSAISQRFKPLVSHIKKEKAKPSNLQKMSDVVILRKISFSNDSADQYSHFNQESSGINSIAQVNNTSDSFYKLTTRCSPYTREGKPGPCGISGLNCIACSLDSYMPYKLQENPGPYNVDLRYSTYFPTCNRVKPELSDISQLSPMGPTIDNLQPHATYLLSNTQVDHVNSETHSISDLDVIVSNEWQSLTHTVDENPESPAVLQTSKISDGCKDFSVYISINSHNSPYKVFTQQSRPSSGGCCETDNINNVSGRPKFKDCSTYVTVIRKKLPYTRELRPGPCGVSETNNNVYYIISQECVTYVTTMSKRNEEISCHSFSTITTNSSPFDFICNTCGKSNSTVPDECTLDMEEKSSESCGTCQTINICRQCATLVQCAQEKTCDCDNMKFNNKTNMSDSDVCELKICSACNKAPQQFKNVVPYTREGIPGPCGVTEYKSDYNPNQSRKLVPYTRERIAGPSGVTEINNTASFLSKRPSVPFTREGIPGPCDIFGTNQITRSFCVTVPQSPFIREGMSRSCGVSNVNKIGGSVCSKIPKPLSNIRTNAQERAREPCDITSSNQIPCSLCCRAPKILSNVGKFIKEGKPGPCSLSETNHKAGASCNMGSKLISNVPYTREGVAGPCGVTETLSVCIKAPKSISKDAPFTREGTSGPCGVSNTNHIVGFLHNAVPKPSSTVGPYTREGIPGPCGVSETNHIAGGPYSKAHKSLSYIRSFTREGVAGSCGVTETDSVHMKAPKLPSKVKPFTREGIPGLCGISNINHIVGFVCEMAPKLSANVGLYTQEEKRGPCGYSETNQVIGDPHKKAHKSLSNISSHKRKGIAAPYCISGTVSVCFMSPKFLSNIGSITGEGRPGPRGVSEINQMVGSSCTKEEIVKPRDFASSRCNLDPKSHSNNKPYTREGIPGPCGVCEINSIVSFLCNMGRKSQLNIEPYTREAVLGPCSISDKDYITSSFSNRGSKPFSSRPLVSGNEKIATFCDHIQPQITANFEQYITESRTEPCAVSSKTSNSFQRNTFPYGIRDIEPTIWNIYESKKASSHHNSGILQLSNIKPNTRQGQRGPCGINDFSFCDTQSCMMCQVFTSANNLENVTRHTVNHNTKDAVTFVTLVPRFTPCTREAISGLCSGKMPSAAVSDKRFENCCQGGAPHIKHVYETRSLHSTVPMLCYNCRSSVAPSTSIVLPTTRVSISTSTVPSAARCGKCMLSTGGIKCTPNQSKRSVESKKCCSICGRSSSKINSHITPVFYCKSLGHKVCDTFASSDLPKSQPCSGCGKTKLVLSCASNPSVKSVAIGTCRTLSKVTPKLIPGCNCGEPTVEHGCNCSENKNIKTLTSDHSSSSESITAASCRSEVFSNNKKKHKKEHMSGSEFGYSETGYKKIIKICKYKNPDGTITDEKRVITVKTKKKCPQKPEGTELEIGTINSCPQDNATNNKTNEVCKCTSCRKTKSEVVQGNKDMVADPKVRQCISAQDYNNTEELKPVFKRSFGTCCNFSQKSDAEPILVCFKNVQDSDNKSKSVCASNWSHKPKSTNKCCNFSKKSHAAPILVPDQNLHDSISKAKCACASNSSPKPIAPKCASKSCNISQKSHAEPIPVCIKSLHDSNIENEPKCDCASNLTPKHPVLGCANNAEEVIQIFKTCLGTNCNTSEKSYKDSTIQLCVKNQQNSRGESKCACASNWSHKPIALKCDNIPNWNYGIKSHTNSKTKCQPHSADNNSKCTCASKSPSKPTDSGYANRQQDANSDLKCKCASKSPPKLVAPICTGILQNSGRKPESKCIGITPTLSIGPECTTKFQSTGSDLDSTPNFVFLVPIRSGCSDRQKNSLFDNCGNKREEGNSKPICEFTNKQVMTVCSNRLQESQRKLTCGSQCANKSQGTDSEPKFHCANNSPIKSPNPACTNNDHEQHDMGSGTKCKYLNKSSPEITAPACANQLQQTDSILMCHCVSKQPPKSNCSTSAVQKDADIASKSETLPDCDVGKEVFVVPIDKIGPEDKIGKSQCHCSKKLHPKPTVPACYNKPQALDISAICACVNHSPAKPAAEKCANGQEDLHSGPKCDCESRSLHKPSAPVCTNRLEDSNSRPKCDCESKSQPGPLGDKKLKDSGCDPICDLMKLTEPVCCNMKSKGNEDNIIFLALTGNKICANRGQGSDSDQKSDCVSKSLSTNLTASVCVKGLLNSSNESSICANRLYHCIGGPKSDSMGKLFPKRTCPVCANRLDNGRTYAFESKSLPKLITSIINCYQVDEGRANDDEGNAIFIMPTGIACVNKLQDLDSCPKSDYMSKSLPKLAAPICANRVQKTDSQSKCECKNKLPPKSSGPICTNRQQDSDSSSKCNCANNSPPKPTAPMCANRLQDSDSGPKSYCAIKSPLKSTGAECANRLQDSDSGSKCDCAKELPPDPTAPMCANRLQDSDSGPKCDCANKSTPKVTGPECANRLQDSDSGPKCDCGNKPPSKSTGPECSNRLQDSDSGPKCDCAKKLPLDPTAPVCANRLQDSDSGPKCDCANKLTRKSTDPECANRLKDSDSVPKYDCMNESHSDPTILEHKNRIQCSDNGPKGDYASKLSPNSIALVCANRLQDSDSGQKCDCANKSSPKSLHPAYGNLLQDNDSGSRCNCAQGVASAPDPDIGIVVDLHGTKENCNCTSQLSLTKPLNKETCYSLQEEIGRVIDLHEKKDNFNCENRSPSTEFQNKEVPTSFDAETGTVIDLHDLKTKSQNKGVYCSLHGENGRVIDLKDSKESCKCGTKLQTNELPTSFDAETGTVIDLHESKTKSHNKEICCSPEEKRGRVIDIQGMKENCKCGNKLPSNKLQNKEISCSPTEEIGRVIDLYDVKDNCECENKQPSSKFQNKETCCPPEGQTESVIDLKGTKENCECGNKLQSNKSHSKKRCCSPEGEIGRVINLQDVTEICKCGIKLPGKNKFQNKEICCSLEGKTGRVIDLEDKKETCNCKNTIPSCKFQSKDVNCSLHGESGMLIQLLKAKANCNGTNIVVSLQKSLRPIQNTVAMSTTDLFYGQPKSTSATTSMKKPDSNTCCSVKIIPKARKSGHCGAHDANKLSIFRNVSMLDALRQLFQLPSSRTQNSKVQYDKNICKTCYSPYTDESESVSRTCSLCEDYREKLIAENELHYRCTNYCSEPASPSSKSANTEDKQYCSTPATSATPDRCYPDENTFNFAEDIPRCTHNANKIAVSTKSRDASNFVRLIKKVKNDHSSMRDIGSHPRH